MRAMRNVRASSSESLGARVLTLSRSFDSGLRSHSVPSPLVCRDRDGGCRSLAHPDFGAGIEVLDRRTDLSPLDRTKPWPDHLDGGAAHMSAVRLPTVLRQARPRTRDHARTGYGADTHGGTKAKQRLRHVSCRRLGYRHLGAAPRGPHERFRVCAKCALAVEEPGRPGRFKVATGRLINWTRR